MTITHSDSPSLFSRYAYNFMTESSSVSTSRSLLPSSSPDTDACTTTSTTTTSNDGNSGKYRCEYCNDLTDNVEQLKQHHTFLHSHLPLKPVLIKSTTIDNISSPSSQDSTTEISSDRHVAGPSTSNKRARATARKSFSFAPNSKVMMTMRKNKRKKVSRGYACKSTTRSLRSRLPVMDIGISPSTVSTSSSSSSRVTNPWTEDENSDSDDELKIEDNLPSLEGDLRCSAELLIAESSSVSYKDTDLNAIKDLQTVNLQIANVKLLIKRYRLDPKVNLEDIDPLNLHLGE